MARKTHLLTVIVEARAPADVPASVFSATLREYLRGFVVSRGAGDFDGVGLSVRVSAAKRRRVLP